MNQITACFMIVSVSMLMVPVSSFIVGPSSLPPFKGHLRVVQSRSHDDKQEIVTSMQPPTNFSFPPTFEDIMRQSDYVAQVRLLGRNGATVPVETIAYAEQELFNMLLQRSQSGLTTTTTDSNSENITDQKLLESFKLDKLLYQQNEIRNDISHIKFEQNEIRNDINHIKFEQNETRKDINHIKFEQNETRNDINHIKFEQNETRNDISLIKDDINHVKFGQKEGFSSIETALARVNNAASHVRNHRIMPVPTTSKVLPKPKSFPKTLADLRLLEGSKLDDVMRYYELDISKKSNSAKRNHLADHLGAGDVI